MTWTSLWWRICLLGRMHRRRLSIAWRLWRRSRRPARPVRLPASSIYSSQYVPYLQGVLNAEIGAPIRLNHYREIGCLALAQQSYTQQSALYAQQQQQAMAQIIAKSSM